MAETTLKEIAQKLGISITTVSKALKNYTDVSPKTKAAVLELAQKMHYYPNSFAVNLRTKESKTIGLIIPTVVHHFFSNVIEGILEEAEKRDYLVIILQSNERYELEKKQVGLLLNKRVDGILMSLTNETAEFEHLNSILEHNTALVLFDKIAKIVKCSKVIIDDRKASYNAVSFLIKKGYKKIAHFRGSYTPQNSIDRFLGYKKALEDHGLVYDPNLVFMCDTNQDLNDAYENAKKIITSKIEVDAIFAVSDLVAMGAMKYLKEAGIEIPKQIAVFGFSNWYVTELISPKLTTIDQPGFEMGVQTAALLFDEINQKKKNLPISTKTITLETKIIEREST